MDWSVLHVRSRCEKKVADYCGHRGIERYLPLRRETKIYQRRKVTVMKPVFPGYVFAMFADEHRTVVLKNSSLVRIMEVVDQARFVREIEQVRKALDADDTLGATDRIARGKAVRVTAGPFRGIEGVVEIIQGASRVVLNVDMIGRGVALNVEMDAVEPVDV